MPKKQLNISETVMSKIHTEHIRMKPRWYFIVGSIAMIGGLIGSIIATIFLVSIIAFSLRTHGPMGPIRFQLLLSNFPWRAPVLAIAGLVSGIWFLKQYDFSYKKNFIYIIILFIITILLSGWLMDYAGISASWSRGRSMRGFYQH